MTFAEWLTQQYLSWQARQGRRRTVKDFANFLGVQQQALSCWLRGDYRPKSIRNVTRLAEKLGPEVYQRLGLPGPLPVLDEKVSELAQTLLALPPQVRARVHQALAAALAEALRSGPGDQPEQTLRILISELQKDADLQNPPDKSGGNTDLSHRITGQAER